MLASLCSDGWTACPELVDDFIGIRNQVYRSPVDSAGNPSYTYSSNEEYSILRTEPPAAGLDSQVASDPGRAHFRLHPISRVEVTERRHL